LLLLLAFVVLSGLTLLVGALEGFPICKNLLHLSLPASEEQLGSTSSHCGKLRNWLNENLLL